MLYTSAFSQLYFFCVWHFDVIGITWKSDCMFSHTQLLSSWKHIIRLEVLLTEEELAWCHQWKSSASPQFPPWWCGLRSKKQTHCDMSSSASRVPAETLACDWLVFALFITKVFLHNHTASSIQSVCSFTQLPHSKVFLKNTGTHLFGLVQTRIYKHISHRR